MSQNNQPQNRLSVHRVSTLIGIKMGIQALSGHIPHDDKAREILAANESNKVVVSVDFPLAMVDTFAAQQSNDRQAMALRLLEALMHHAGMSTDLSQGQLDDLVTKAWSTVAAMERERSAVELLATLSNSST